MSLCIALLLTAPLLPVASWPGHATETREERIAAVLRRHEADTRTLAELARELARLGPELAPLWRRWLVGEGVEAVFLAPGEFRPEAWAVSPEAAGELALATLLALPPEVVLADLEHGLTRDGPGPSEYLAAFRVLQGLGSARGLALFWQMVERLGPDVTELPRYRDAANAALAAILARDRGVWAPLTKRLAAPAELETQLFLTAAYDAGRPEAHELVLRLLDHPSVVARFEGLRTLARLERDHPWRCEPQLVERVGREWPALTTEERLAALAWLGSSEDPRALAPLRRFLDDPDPLIAANAGRALAELAGVSFGDDEAAWERWEERELRWQAEELEETLESLSGGASVAAASFVRLASHPLFRREIARAVGARLPALDAPAQALGAAFLLGLRTRAALPALVRLYQHTGDSELRGRLQAALIEQGVSVARGDEQTATPVESL